MHVRIECLFLMGAYASLRYYTQHHARPQGKLFSERTRFFGRGIGLETVAVVVVV